MALMNKEELLQEIAAVEEELEKKTKELDEVRKLLNKEPLEDLVDDEITDEGEEGKEKEEEFDDFDEDEEDAEEEEFDEDEEDSSDEDLKKKEIMLAEEVLVLQMKLVALNRQLKNILADEGMSEFSDMEG